MFDNVLFHWKIAVEDEDKVADDSREHTISELLSEIVCVGAVR